jgi:hypothetical protein
MSLALFSHAAGLSERTYYRTPNIEKSPMSSYHGPGANSAPRTCGEQLVLWVFGERPRALEIT